MHDDDFEAPEAVAIIGMAGRFPAAADVAELWRKLLAGEESITFWDRETLRQAGVSEDVLDRPEHVAAKGVLERPEYFDAEFFGLSPREAEIMDPQVRLFLETCWQASEDAGYDIRTFGSTGGPAGGTTAGGRAGVYGGSNLSTYLVHNLLGRQDLLAQVGELQVRISNDKDALATWTAYKLDLRGPCVTVQTACSTSLVAVHLASQGLLDGECDFALAGGVGLTFPLERGYLYQEGGILSADGRCRTFDAAADGTVPGTGVAVVALRRLSDALEDGDAIRAVILGTAISNDGSRKAGYTAPGVEGQMRAIAEALSLADVDPSTIGYVEAHGSGTRLGDPIEVDALTRAYRRHTDRRGFCALGSVKANLGHLDSAAGVTGLVKTVCALEAGKIPPMLHFERPNPALRLEESPFYVPTEATDWPSIDGEPRRGGVSSFGIGGTNVHAVLEEAPDIEPGSPSRAWQPLVVSARSSEALEAACERLADHLEAHADESLPDVAYTLAIGRHAFVHRRAVVASDVAGAVSALRGGASRRRVTGRAGQDERGVAFLFPGVGDHHPGMGRELYENEPVYRGVVDEAAEILGRRCGLDLVELLYPADGAGESRGGPDLKAMLRRRQEPSSEAERRLDATSRAHPAIFVVEVALARLLMEWGIVPRAMIGYSLGEYVAAHLAGVMDFEESLVLVTERARVIDELPEGAMLAVPLSAEALAPRLEEAPGLALSAVNGDALSVVGGEREAIDALGRRLEAEGVACRELRSRHPFHTPLMEPARQALAGGFAALELKAPEIPFLSNVTGTWITDEQAADPEYWSRHLVETVRFTDGLAELLGDDAPVLLEVGPGKALATLARQHPACGRSQPVLTTLGDRWDGAPADEALVSAVAGLWVGGAGPDWSAWYGDERRLRRPLPTYPFERRRFWVEPAVGGAAQGKVVEDGQPTQPAAIEGKAAELGHWFYLPSWRRLPPRSELSATPPAGPYLLFDDGSALAAALAAELTANGEVVERVRVGDSWTKPEAEGEPFTLRPGEREDHGALLDELARRDRMPRVVLHLWSLPAGPDTGNPDALATAGETLLDHGFYSLLFLAQALGERPAVEGGTLLAVVASQLWQVQGDEPLCPPKAALFGPAQVIPQESPSLDCRLFDLALDAAEPVAGSADSLARRLLVELTDEPATAEPRLALRGRHRWAQQLEQVPIASPPRPVPRLERGGGFLVTSCEGTGLAVAEHLAQVAEARIVLLDDGKTSSEAARAKHRERLAALGETIEVTTLELAWDDPARIEEAVAEARQKLGRIDGVFHTAAVPDAGLVQLKTRRLAAPVLAPKVAGTLALLRAFAAEPPGFLALYSASAAWLGGVGQVDHAAANAVLLAVAQDRARRRSDDPALGHTVAIAWDTFLWEGEAQGKGLSEAMARQLEENLERFGIDAEEHAELLDRVLAGELELVVVSGRSFRQVVDEMEAMKSADLYAQIAGSELAPAHQRPELDTEYRAPSTSTEETLAQLWSEAFGIDRVGVDDDFFDLEGNSLMAVQIVTRLRSALEVDLAMGALFEAPTIAQLAERVDLLRAETLAAEEAAGEDEEAELARLLAEVEDLSPEEAERLLAEEGEAS